MMNEWALAIHHFTIPHLSFFKFLLILNKLAFSLLCNSFLIKTFKWVHLPGVAQHGCCHRFEKINKTKLKMNNWFFGFLTSSIGKKLLMALTGIFLILFLAVHLAGNLQLLHNDGGVAFNVYADFMGNNPLIQFISKGNFFFILLHAVLGTFLWWKNRAARGAQGYAVTVTRATETSPFFAKYMWAFGVVILVFIIVHLVQFWAMMHYGEIGYGIDMVNIEGKEVRNLYALVSNTFLNPGFVVFYVVSMIVIAFHLWHGFQSAFQTMGLKHPKYSPIIKFIGAAYSVLVPLGFAVIPIVFYLRNA